MRVRRYNWHQLLEMFPFDSFIFKWVLYSLSLRPGPNWLYLSLLGHSLYLLLMHNLYSRIPSSPYSKARKSVIVGSFAARLGRIDSYKKCFYRSNHWSNRKTKSWQWKVVMVELSWKLQHPATVKIFPYFWIYIRSFCD